MVCCSVYLVRSTLCLASLRVMTLGDLLDDILVVYFYLLSAKWSLPSDNALRFEDNKNLNVDIIK